MNWSCSRWLLLLYLKSGLNYWLFRQYTKWPQAMTNHIQAANGFTSETVEEKVGTCPPTVFFAIAAIQARWAASMTKQLLPIPAWSEFAPIICACVEWNEWGGVLKGDIWDVRPGKTLRIRYNERWLMIWQIFLQRRDTSCSSNGIFNSKHHSIFFFLATSHLKTPPCARSCSNTSSLSAHFICRLSSLHFLAALISPPLRNAITLSQRLNHVLPPLLQPDSLLDCCYSLMPCRNDRGPATLRESGHSHCPAADIINPDDRQANDRLLHRPLPFHAFQGYRW